MCGPIYKLARGLTYLNLSKTLLTSRGVNRIAETLQATKNISSSLRHLDLSGNTLKAEELIVGLLCCNYQSYKITDWLHFVILFILFRIKTVWNTVLWWMLWFITSFVHVHLFSYGSNCIFLKVTKYFTYQHLWFDSDLVLWLIVVTSDATMQSSLLLLCSPRGN